MPAAKAPSKREVSHADWVEMYPDLLERLKQEIKRIFEEFGGFGTILVEVENGGKRVFVKATKSEMFTPQAIDDAA